MEQAYSVLINKLPHVMKKLPYLYLTLPTLHYTSNNIVFDQIGNIFITSEPY